MKLGWMPGIMAELCDTNVWLALTVERHTHHARAVAWFESLEPSNPVAFNRMTQLSFLRLLTSESVLGDDAVTNRKAITLYQAVLSDVRCRFEPEPPDLQRTWLEYAGRRQKSPKVWMDGYLAAFSKQTGLRLVTFDRGFKYYTGLSLLVL